MSARQPMEQLPLLEPTGSEVPALAMQQLRRAKAALDQSEIALTRGWYSVARAFTDEALRHHDEAECLAMLADFERLGGVWQ